jgi:hypothetical protein
VGRSYPVATDERSAAIYLRQAYYVRQPYFFAVLTMAPKSKAQKVVSATAAPASGVAGAPEVAPGSGAAQPAPGSPGQVQTVQRLAKLALGKNAKKETATAKPAIVVHDSPAASDGAGPAASDGPGAAASDGPGRAASAGPVATQENEAGAEEKKDVETKKGDEKEGDKKDKRGKAEKKDKKAKGEKSDKKLKKGNKEKSDKKDKKEKKEKKQKRRKCDDEDSSLETPRIGKREEDTQHDSDSSEVYYMSRVCIFGYTKKIRSAGVRFI